MVREDIAWRTPMVNYVILCSSRKFGLVHVDFENGTLARTLKKSAWFFQEMAATRRVPYAAPTEDENTFLKYYGQQRLKMILANAEK